MTRANNPEPRRTPLPANFRRYPFKEKIALPTVSPVDEPSFFSVLEQRRSRRRLGDIRMEEVSRLLWYTNKVKEAWVSENGLIRSKRMAPSAGAIHPIDVFVSLPAKLQERQFCYYDPYHHQLQVVDQEQKVLTAFFSHLEQSLSLEHVLVIWFLADIERTMAHYHNAQSLVWRDSGALIMLTQLVCEALKLGYCPFGTLAEPLFGNLFPDETQINMGGGVIGGCDK
jgi:SagB-type dehydrogenase family enzyme